MTGSDDAPFAPRPRAASDERAANDRRNLIDELERISQRLETRVVGSERHDFSNGSISYDAASMVVVRIFGLLERRDSEKLREALTSDEFAALRTIRHIVAHGGDATMNDESFWQTATRDLPAIVTRLRTVVGSPAEPPE